MIPDPIYLVRTLKLCPQYFAWDLACLAGAQRANYRLVEARIKVKTKREPGGGGHSNIKKVGMLVENFEIDPYKGDQSGRGSRKTIVAFLRVQP